MGQLKNVHDKLELMLSTHSRVEEAQVNIDISKATYNFLQFSEIRNYIDIDTLIGMYIYTIKNYHCLDFLL